MNRIILTIAAALIATGHAYATDLATYKATYEKEMEAIVLEHGMRMTNLGQQYMKGLDELLTKVRSAGDLNKTTAVMDEIKRFSNENRMPEKPSAMLDIQNIQTSFTQQASAYEADKAKKIITLTAKYDQALERLQKSLVSSSKLNEAKAVQAQRKKTHSSPEVNNAKKIALKTTQAQKQNKSPSQKDNTIKEDNQASKYPRSFAEFTKQVEVVSGGLLAGSQSYIAINGEVMADHKGAETSRGIHAVAIHEGDVILNERFDTFGSDSESDRFAAAIKKLPTRAFVVLAVSDEATGSFTFKAQRAINDLGGKTGLYKQPYRTSYICIGQKGLSKGKAIELISVKLLSYPSENQD